MATFVRVALGGLGFPVAKAEPAGRGAGGALGGHRRGCGEAAGFPGALQQLHFRQGGNGEVLVREAGNWICIARVDNEAAPRRAAGRDKPGAETKLCGTGEEPGTCSEPSAGRRGSEGQTRPGHAGEGETSSEREDAGRARGGAAAKRSSWALSRGPCTRSCHQT